MSKVKNIYFEEDTALSIDLVIESLQLLKEQGTKYVEALVAHGDIDDANNYESLPIIIQPQKYVH
jgi:hypothetical protein